MIVTYPTLARGARCGRVSPWSLRLTGAVLATANALFVLAAGDRLRYDSLNGSAFLLSATLVGAVLMTHTSDALTLARTFLLVVVGYFAAGVKAFLGGDALFSGYEPASQSLEVTVIMLRATAIALLGSELGFLAAVARHNSQRAVDRSMTASSDVRAAWRLAAAAGALLTLVGSFVFLRSYGASVLTSGYLQAEGVGVAFGSAGVLGVVGLYAIFVAGRLGHVRGWRTPFLAAFLLFVVLSQLLSGLRMDAMSSIFGLIVLHHVTAGRRAVLSPSRIAWALTAVAFFEVWGVARTALAVGLSLGDILSATGDGFVAADGLRWGTVSAIGSTFANTVLLLREGAVGVAHGSTYLDWLLRLPPTILFPGRPDDLAFLFQAKGLVSGGGFFEVAEGLLNFGYLGAMLSAGCISFFVARAQTQAITSQSMLAYFVLFAVLSVFLRGAWYQSFAFVRALSVVFSLYLAVAVAHVIIAGVRERMTVTRA